MTSKGRERIVKAVWQAVFGQVLRRQKIDHTRLIRLVGNYAEVLPVLNELVDGGYLLREGNGTSYHAWLYSPTKKLPPEITAAGVMDAAERAMFWVQREVEGLKKQLAVLKGAVERKDSQLVVTDGKIAGLQKDIERVREGVARLAEQVGTSTEGAEPLCEEQHSLPQHPPLVS